MRHNKFFQTTFILLIGGLITKILGFIIKIIYTRFIGEAGLGLYMLVFPTYSLLLTIAQLGLPIAISKLVAEERQSSQKIVFSIIPVMIGLNILVIVTMIFVSPFIADVLLKQSDATGLLIACALTLPFISLSSILKGYFYGKQKMMPHTVSNILEQIVRLILIILIIPFLLEINLIVTLIGLILLNIVSEIVSIIVFLFFLPKKFVIKKDDIKPDGETIKEIARVSLPTVSSRFIGNVGYFFEPIILTNLLLWSGYSAQYVLLQYGIYNGYVLGILLLPSFFSMAISSSLVPEISKFFSAKNMVMVKRRCKQALGLSLLVGLTLSSIIFIFTEELLAIIFNTSSGITYIKVLAPVFVLFYIEGPLISILQAIGKAKISMKITLYGIIIKLVVMAILSLCQIGIYSLIIAEIVNILFVVGFNYKNVRKFIY